MSDHWKICHRCDKPVDELKPFGRTPDELICYKCWMAYDYNIARIKIGGQ